MKQKLWLIPAVLLLATLLIFTLWDTVFVYAAPKAALAEALADTAEDLEDRFEDSPLPILLQGISPEGENTIILQLDTHNDLLGNIGYNMTIQTTTVPRRLQAQGLVTTPGGTLDLSIYLDGDFAAVSSQSLLDSSYYGITYDTFPQDVRSNNILKLLVNEDTMGQWDEAVASLQQFMATDTSLPEVSEADIKAILGGILSLKATVSTEALDSGHCHCIRFSATGQEIAAMAERYASQLGQTLQSLIQRLKADPDAVVHTQFYLRNQQLLKAAATIYLDGQETTAEFHLGTEPERNDLVITVTRGSDALRFTISTTQSETVYQEKLDIVTGQDHTVLNYTWLEDSGLLEMDLIQSGQRSRLALNLQETDSGFRLKTNQFELLMSILAQQEWEGESRCTMTVSRGAAIATPEYKNFDRWSLDDMLVLLGSIGSLFGLKIG